MGGYPEVGGKKKVLDGPPSLWTISTEPSALYTEGAAGSIICQIQQ